MDPRLQRTEFAAQAATLADQFATALEAFLVSGHRVEMTAPENSTGGGVQALQHIRLVPPSPAGRTCIVGNANRSTRSAELRSLEYVDQLALERFGQRTGFDPRQYAAFIDAASQFLDNFGLQVKHTSHSASLRTARPAAAPRGFTPLAVVMIVLWSVLVLAIGLGVGVIATRGRLGH